MTSPRCLAANETAKAWLLIKKWILMCPHGEDFWVHCVAFLPPRPPVPPGQLWNATVEAEVVCSVRLLLVLLQRWVCDEFARPGTDCWIRRDQINLFSRLAHWYVPILPSLTLTGFSSCDFSLLINSSVLLLDVIHACVAGAPASPPSLITLNNRCATCHLVPHAATQPPPDRNHPRIMSRSVSRCPLTSGHP